MNAGASSPEAEPVVGGNDLDVVPLPDGRTVWAQFYGEAPRESIYEGTQGTILTGHVHFEDDKTYESYLPTLDGRVLRVVTEKSGSIIDGPNEVSLEQQLEVIELLDPYLFPTD